MTTLAHVLGDRPDAADQHRPTERAALFSAAVEMSRVGLTPRDIATTLNLTTAAVVQLVNEGSRVSLQHHPQTASGGSWAATQAADANSLSERRNLTADANRCADFTDREGSERGR
jgi:hypothetical protein